MPIDATTFTDAELAQGIQETADDLREMRQERNRRRRGWVKGKPRNVIDVNKCCTVDDVVSVVMRLGRATASQVREAIGGVYHSVVRGRLITAVRRGVLIQDGESFVYCERKTN